MASGFLLLGLVAIGLVISRPAFARHWREETPPPSDTQSAVGARNQRSSTRWTGIFQPEITNYPVFRKRSPSSTTAKTEDDGPAESDDRGVAASTPRKPIDLIYLPPVDVKPVTLKSGKVVYGPPLLMERFGTPPDEPVKKAEEKKTEEKKSEPVADTSLKGLSPESVKSAAAAAVAQLSPEQVAVVAAQSTEGQSGVNSAVIQAAQANQSGASGGSGGGAAASGGGGGGGGGGKKKKKGQGAGNGGAGAGAGAGAQNAGGGGGLVPIAFQNAANQLCGAGAPGAPGTPGATGAPGATANGAAPAKGEAKAETKSGGAWSGSKSA